MAPVNGCQHPDCEDPADDSNSHLFGPHGFEGQENVSANGAGAGGTAPWGTKGSSSYQISLISQSPGTQDGNRQSKPLRPHRTHYKSVLETQSFKSFVSPTIIISHCSLSSH
jgi:hypothetical protein